MLRFLLIIALLPLTLLAQDKQSEKKPDVHLNHAFIVPDAETYEAIRNSDFVKQFAVWEERTTHRKDITYTGFYLYGRHTYFEFLKPDERTPVGTSKIAFGVDRTGDLDLLQKRRSCGLQDRDQDHHPVLQRQGCRLVPFAGAERGKRLAAQRLDARIRADIPA